jgi:hypothetical protein
MHVAMDKVNQEETEPVVVCSFIVNMLEVDLEDQLLHPYLLNQKKGTEWYFKLFKRLLIVTLCNTMVMYQSLPNIKNGHRPSPKSHRMTFPGVYSCCWKEGRTSKKACGVHKTQEKERIYLLM